MVKDINKLINFFFITFIINFFITIYTIYNFLDFKVFQNKQGIKLNIKNLKEIYDVDLIVKADEKIKQGKSKINITKTYGDISY